MDERQPQKSGYGKGYGKRPLWQWVLIYVVVGAIVYGAIYYFAVAKKGGYSSTNTGYQGTYQPTNTGSQTYPATNTGSQGNTNSPY